MNSKDFIRLGIPLGESTRRATDFVSRFVLAGGDKTRLAEEVKGVASASVCGSKISVRRVMEVFKAKRLDASEGH